MGPRQEPAQGQGLRDRKRAATRQRIAEQAARLATERGIAATTADQIADAAGVGRATFFRYFESKELAVAAGLSDVGLYVFTQLLTEQPSELGPLEAVRATHAALAAGYEAHRQMYLDQALLTRASPAMYAWMLHLYVDWEVAIADAVAPRFADLEDDDPRPRLIGAMTMAAARLACDAWVADDGRGDLPELIRRHLARLEDLENA
jgi:AcrR family transcriptional regulator